MDEGTGWCLGCLRTLDEIAAWALLSDEAKQAIWTALRPRRVEWARRTDRKDGREGAP
jgi:predicted Fe-S protein YdhL (DUF1289 family)